MAESPYKLLGKLPPRVSFSSRYKVFHRPMERYVEFRFQRGGGAEHGRRYLQELEELSVLDHPCFLPLLDKGSLKDRQCYVVPFREHRTLPQLVAAKQFFLAQAVACVRSLSTALAAIHEAGFLLGPISPRQVAWNEVAASAYFLHHRVGTPAYLQSDRLKLPADIDPVVPPTRQSDLFHWGVFAYFLLSQGALPYENSSRTLIPLAEKCPRLPRGLAVAVEAALSRAPSERPEDGIELGKVLLVEDAVPAYAALPLETPQGPAEEKPLSASERFQALAEDCQQLHLSTGYWLPRGFAPEEEQPDESEDLEGAAASPEAPDLELFQSSKTGSIQALATPPVGAPKLVPSLSAAVGGAPAPSGETLGRPLAVGRPLAMGAALLGALLLGAFLLPPGSPPGPAVNPEPGVTDALPTSEDLRPLPEGAARAFQRDPQVRELLLLEKLPAKSFERVWKRVESLLQEGRLPPALRDRERLESIQSLYREYPERGCQALLEFLADLRLVVGEAEKR